MRRILTLALLLISVFAVREVRAQQDAMFTKYMFNTLTYNPAYAGYYDYMYASLIHRTQWLNIEGAPTSQSLSLHSPLRNDRVGVGFNLVSDKVGPTYSVGANFAYAYRIPVGEKARLSIGLQVGMLHWRADWTQFALPPDALTDPAFATQPVRNLPNFGAGIFFHTPRFFAGVSANYAGLYRHYYATVGAAIPLNGEDLILRPVILVKNVGLLSKFSKDVAFQTIGAPTVVDLDMSLMFFKQFSLGLAMRGALESFSGKSTLSSGDIWMSYILSNGLRIGAAYDFPLTELNQITTGSFEVMVGYEMNFRSKKIVTPRYF